MAAACTVEAAAWPLTCAAPPCNHTQVRGRLSLWHMRPLPPEAACIGSSYDLPAISPLGLLQPRTPLPAAAAFGGGLGGAGGASAGGAGTGGGFGACPGTGFGSGSAGYGGGAAAYSSSMLGALAAGNTPLTGGGSFAALSGGASTAKR